MGKSLNQVILLGRITKDIELATTTSGKNIANFSLAVDKGNDQASFFDITAWEKTAEILSQYTRKGSKVLIQGRLDQQTWEKDGKKNSKVVVIAYDVTLLDPKQEGTTTTNIQNTTTAESPIDLSEIPF